jgi:hypothetical protein
MPINLTELPSVPLYEYQDTIIKQTMAFSRISFSMSMLMAVLSALVPKYVIYPVEEKS